VLGNRVVGRKFVPVRQKVRAGAKKCETKIFTVSALIVVMAVRQGDDMDWA
jgi:hypothetical protein